MPPPALTPCLPDGLLDLARALPKVLLHEHLDGGLREATLLELLAARGLLLVGLDVIGDHLTEINVTSPTCFAEITQQTGFNVAGMFVDALERAVAKD